MINKTYDGLSAWILILPLIAVTFLQKFGVQIGTGELSLAAPLIWSVVAFGFFSGRLELHKKRLAFYCITMGVLVLTQLIGGYNFSVLSLALMLLIHAPYIFGFKKGMIKPGVELEFFQKSMVVLAVFGIVQYFAQFVIGAEWAFFMEQKFPQEIILQNYNSLNILDYDRLIYKSNGFFLVEPSFFSQIMALCIIIEILFFHNIKRIILFLFALAVTFSGTGILLLLTLVPFYLMHQKRFILLLGLLIVVLSSPFWAPHVGLEKTVERSTEIAQPGSSGFARFVGPVIAINEFVVPAGNKEILLGLGAGSMLRTIKGYFDFEVATSTWGKMIFEYGIIGSLIYFIFMGYIFFSTRKNIFLTCALLVMFFLLAEYILSPVAHGLILVLLLWGERKPEQEEPEEKELVKNELSTAS